MTQAIGRDGTPSTAGKKGPARGLGRGLSALFAEATPAETTEARVRSIPVEKLVPGQFQPRRAFDEEALAALTESVRAQGILQPLLVRPLADRPEHFEIIAGERRWRAAQRAQLHDVPALVRDLDDRDTLQVALIENIQRQDLTPIEEAEAYRRLIEEFGHTQEALAQGVGKSRSHVANMLRLLTLPAGVRGLLDEGKISAGHARALVTLPNAEPLAREIVAKGLSVRAAERMAQAAKDIHLGGPKPARLTVVSDTARLEKAMAVAQARDSDTAALERDLSLLLGLKVSIETIGRGGRLVIDYQSLDQLDDVIQRLNGPTAPVFPQRKAG